MDEKTLGKLIDSFNSDEKIRMYEGVQYYRGQNTAIMQRRKEFYSITNRKNVEDCTKANHKLAGGFTRILVDQKVYYSINGKINIEGLKDTQLKESKFRKTLKKLAFNASNEIYGVLFWYIEKGELKYKIFNSQQILINYNEDDNEVIDSIIRVYKVTINDEDVEAADVIDSIGTTTWLKIDNIWIEGDEPVYHLSTKTKSGETTIDDNPIDQEGDGWGRVPVSVLYNNETRQTDLEMFKADVDMYDIIKSDFGNNFEDFQELYWVLKGYKGQDPNIFMDEFKKSRILKVSKEGDAHQVAQEVPYAARVAALNILKIDIYLFGMGVDPTAITGQTTNYTIKALFANLDLKANGFEEEIQEFMDSALYFINRAQELTNKGTQLEDLLVKFSRAIILNKNEIIESLIKQVGFRAKEKLLKEHPDVEDVDAELKALEDERAKQVKDLGGALGFEEDDLDD